MSITISVKIIINISHRRDIAREKYILLSYYRIQITEQGKDSKKTVLI